MASASEFWGGATWSLQNNRSSLRRKISQLMRRPQMQLLRAKMVALTGAAASQSINETRKRIVAPSDGELSGLTLGGARTYESVDVDAVNTVTSGSATATDETAIETMLQQDSAPSAYATDASGNGGGGKGGM